MRTAALFTFILLALGLAAAGEGDWPCFRGPHGNGLTDERDLPVKWSAKENIAWKAKLPGPGASSPITWGDRVFITCYSGHDDGRAAKGDLSGLRRHVLCLDRKTGKPLWQKDIAAKLPENEYAGQILQHGYSTSTPVTDGQRVYVFLGRSGVYAFDLEGKELWQADLGDGISKFGTGSSPVLFRGRVLVNATVEGRKLVALDCKTGKVVWKTPVNGSCWSTPVVVEPPGGKPEIVLNGAAAMYGYNAETGKDKWEVDLYGSDYASSTPVARKGIIYAMGSGVNGRFIVAVRSGGKGDVTETHVVWKQTKVGAAYCSPILVGEHLYYASAGQICCLRADNGKVVFQERLSGVGLEYASPVAGDGKLYFFTRKGTGYVLAAKDKLDVLAENELGDTGGYVASPAVSHGQILVRAGSTLWCIGKK